MVKLQEAENQIITSYEVYARRPNDSDLLVAAIEPIKHCSDARRIW
jgi:IS5 family transposase